MFAYSSCKSMVSCICRTLICAVNFGGGAQKCRCSGPKTRLSFLRQTISSVKPKPLPFSFQLCEQCCSFCQCLSLFQKHSKARELLDKPHRNARAVFDQRQAYLIVAHVGCRCVAAVGMVSSFTGQGSYTPEAYLTLRWIHGLPSA
jgi:hypothetical protein